MWYQGEMDAYGTLIEFAYEIAYEAAYAEEYEDIEE